MGQRDVYLNSLKLKMWPPGNRNTLSALSNTLMIFEINFLLKVLTRVSNRPRKSPGSLYRLVSHTQPVEALGESISPLSHV